MHIILHEAPAESRLHIRLHSPLVLGCQPVGQAVQSWVEGSRHVGVRRMRPVAKGRGGARREAVDQRSEEVGVARLAGLHQTVHVDVEGLLLEGTGEGPRGEVLQPREQRQVEFIAAVPAQQIHAEQHLPLSDLLASRFALEDGTRAKRLKGVVG